MDPTLRTPRLLLIRLTNTTCGSQHVQWFHENWSDAAATAWSLHGPCRSLFESRAWMIEHLTQYDNMFYAVFAGPEDGDGDGDDDDKEGVERVEAEENVRVGQHLGSVSLRRQIAGPAVQPPPRVQQSSALSEPAISMNPIDLRVMGYAFFEGARGKGYATEANKALLDAYAISVTEEKAKGEKDFYVEAGVDEENPASQAVLRKLGLEKVGWKEEEEEEEEKVFLNGAWRDPGYWVYGMYV